MPRQMMQVGWLATGMSGNLAAPTEAVVFSPTREEPPSIASAIVFTYW